MNDFTLYDSNELFSLTFKDHNLSYSSRACDLSHGSTTHLIQLALLKYLHVTAILWIHRNSTVATDTAWGNSVGGPDYNPTAANDIVLVDVSSVSESSGTGADRHFYLE